MSDSKVQTLDAEMFRAWVNLLCMASANKPRGYLPPMKQVAYILHVREDEARRVVAELMEAGLVDSIEGQLRPHNWDVRQGRVDLSTERSRRYRQKTKEKLKAADKAPPPPPDPPSEPMQRVANRDATNGGTVANAHQERKREEIRGEDRELIPDVINSPTREDDDDDSDLPCDDVAYNQAANRLGYQVVSRGHRDAIEAARSLFGDEQALAVGHDGYRINGHLKGQWRFFLSALRAAKKTWKRTGRGKDDFAFYVLSIAKDHRSYGIRCEPVALPDAAPEEVEATHPRVYRAADARPPAPFLAEREKTNAAMRAYKPKPPRDATS